MRNYCLRGGESCQAQRGGYIMELAIVLFGVAVLVLGGFDVVRLMQARGALRTGVQEGLRCLYASEGSCRSERATEGYRETFDIALSGRPFGIPVEQVMGEASWRVQPQWFVRPRSRTLESVLYDVPTTWYGEHEVRHFVVSHNPHLRVVGSLPLLDGTNPLSPNFVAAPGRGVPALKTYKPSSRIEKSTTGTFGYEPNMSSDDRRNYQEEMLIGSMSFSLPVEEVVSNYSELLSVLGDPAVGASALGCVQEGQEDACQPDSAVVPAPRTVPAIKIPIFLRIEGEIPDSFASGAQGTVYASMTVDGRTVRLGGRQIERGGRANFLTRFVPDSNLSASMKKAYDSLEGRDPRVGPGASSYSSDHQKYGYLFQVTPGATMKIDFFLRSHARVGSAASSGRVAWRLEQVQLFFPRLEFVNEAFECGYQADTCSCKTLPSGQRSDFLKVGSRPPILKSLGRGICEEEKPAGALDPVEVDAFLESVRSKSRACGEVTIVRAADATQGCQSKRYQYSCPSGTALKRSYVGCSEAELEFSESDAVRSCNVPAHLAEQFDPIHLATSPIFEEPLEVAPGCEAVSAPACAVRDFHPDVHQPRFIPWVGATPQDIERCQVDQDPDPKPEVVLSSSFEGSRCLSEEARLETFRADYRRRFNVPSEVPVRAHLFEVSQRVVPAEPDDQCLKRVQLTWETPKPFRENASHADVRALCRYENVTCELSSRLTPHRVGIDREASSSVKRWVEDAVLSFYPRAEIEERCTEATRECLRVRVSEAPDSSVQVAASMSVPLFFSSLVGQEQVAIQYKEAALPEKLVVAAR